MDTTIGVEGEVEAEAAMEEAMVEETLVMIIMEEADETTEDQAEAAGKMPVLENQVLPYVEALLLQEQDQSAKE